jgi:succinoglycan biosynthesis transport protein ExoP
VSIEELTDITKDDFSSPKQQSVDVFRHTHLTFLVNQGARLNHLEQFAGYIMPTELALYRGVNRQGKLIELEEVNSVFPFRAVTA